MYKNINNEWSIDCACTHILRFIIHDIRTILLEFESQLKHDLMTTSDLDERYEKFKELDRVTDILYNIILNIDKVKKIIDRVKQFHNGKNLREKIIKNQTC